VVTRTNVDAVLEASHIDPHSTSGLNHTDNGLLLRSDIHALFDDDLLRIDPDTLSVVVDASLKDTIYWDLNGRQLFSRTSITEQRYALLRARWQRREPGPVEI
jgi:predicted restriction endonuclease